jgi:hypothetical protein
MKRIEKYAGVGLAILFLAAGTYLLEESIHDSGQYAEESVLVGRLLMALALPAMLWSIKVHLLTRALQRHMRGR